MEQPYFKPFEKRVPPHFPPMSQRRHDLWHFLAGTTVAAALWYLHWRWSASLNPDALVFSIIVAGAETLFFLGTVLFYFDIWAEGDTPRKPAPSSRSDVHLGSSAEPISVDVFITTYDEDENIVAPSIQAALDLQAPHNTSVHVHVLDDGNRPLIEHLARRFGVNYITRTENIGFKAGNLRNAMFQTQGDFILICDADTRVFPSFLSHTLGYFTDPKVAWVQTPHWFYDIPEGRSWQKWLQDGTYRWPVWLATPIRLISGQRRIGQDPFLSEPTVFFDIIQRRRNRHGASFCCGAGSIHRREAIFDNALRRKSNEALALSQRYAGASTTQSARNIMLEPYRFHVSEDIFTSILLHSDSERQWTSVYHPQAEARMLSPWSMQAWATQRLKYAGGTFDIMLRENPVFRKGMPWRTKLHYASTFWSYLTSLWTPVLLLAPAFSLVSGLAPVEAYSTEFFLHFLPMVILGELAMLASCKGYAIGSGRALAISTLPLQMRALWLVLRGKRPKFPPTPKTPRFGDGFRYIYPNLALLALLALSGAIGTFLTFAGSEDHSRSLLVVNLFWLGWNMFLVSRITFAARWRPPTAPIAVAAQSFAKEQQHA